MKNNDSFRHSVLDRAKPKHHFFHSFLKRHHSDTGLVEDRTSSVTIVRIIGGLLMLHLVIIGGVLLRGHIAREDADHSPRSGVTPPPSASHSPSVLPPPATANSASPAAKGVPAVAVQSPPASNAPLAPLSTTNAPVAASSGASAAAQNHITTDAAQDDSAEEVEDAPTVVQVAAASPVRHRVARGDSWESIAGQYGVSPAALQAANPGASGAVPVVGSSLVVPVASTGSPQAASAHPSVSVKASPSAQPATGDATYTVQRGETLSRIARKVKVPLKELLQINNIKDANRIQPGMQLKLRK